MLTVAGTLLVIAGGVCGHAAYKADEQLQSFRLRTAKVPLTAMPFRLRRGLYRPEGHYLVGRAWRFIAAMIGLTLLGIFFIAEGARAVEALAGQLPKGS
jgi:hypothetical protein